MKSVLKYIIAVILVGSLAAWFIPIIEIEEKMTLLELMKIGFGFYSGGGDKEILFGSIYRAFSLCSWEIAAFGSLTLLELFSVVVFRKRLPYIISFLGSLVGCVAVAAFLWMADTGISQVEEEMEILSIEISGRLCLEPVFIFLGVYALVLFFSLLGIWLCGRTDGKPDGKPEGAETELEADYVDVYPNDIWEQEAFGRLTDDEVKNKGRENNQWDVPAAVTPAKTEQSEFHGAVLGEPGMFYGKAYPLNYEEECFFVADRSEISMSDENEISAIASVYYVDEYEEYCIRPLQRMCVFLESGQPLGKDRIYYLPRGMRVHVWNGYPDGREGIFTLA